ncbi:MAG: hypothetical protein ACOYI6_07375 [Christensenellales bacterium]|jgi:hypothetical protein
MKTKTQRALICLLLAMMLIPALPVGAKGILPAVPGLSLLPLHITDLVVTMAVQGDVVALLSMDEETGAQSLALYQTPQMEQLASADYTSQPVPESYDDIRLGILPDQRVYAANLSNKTLDIFSADLSQRTTSQFTGVDYPISVYLQPDQQVLWIGTGDSQLMKLDIDSGELKEMHPQVPAGFEFYQVLGIKDGRLRLHYYKNPDLDLVVELAENGSTSFIPVMRGHSYLDAENVMLSDSQTALLGTLGQENYLHIVDWRRSECLVEIKGNHLLTNRFEEMEVILRVYDAGRFQMVNELILPHEADDLYFMQSAMISDNQVLLVYQGYEPNAFQLYLWAFLSASQPQDVSMRQISYPDFMAEQDQLSRDIKARHGVTVHIREAGAGFRNAVYYAQPARSELPLRHALLLLRDFLDSLPSGLVSEALLWPYTEFAIYLSGPITQKSAEGIVYPSGFSAEEGSLRYLALNVQDYAFQSTLHHEFMHLLEDRLSQTAYEVDKPVFMFWDSLGPKEAEHHGFALTYTDESGDTFSDLDYTSFHEKAQAHPDSVWFVDAYSRTWPLEDRARLFEHMMTKSPYTDPFTFPNLRKKAQILAALLRQAFPSLRQVDTAPWETQIEKTADYEAFLASVYDELTAP